VELVWPTAEHLPGYIDALERGWSPVNLQGEAAARHELERIARDPAGFLALQVDREARGGPIMRADGTMVPRLPGYRRWLWDGEFCGVISLRWQPGTCALPLHCPGHVGYSVVPWKQGRGYAKRALAALLPDARREGLTFIELTTDLTNAPSRRVIEANGGFLVARFQPDPRGILPEQLRYRIPLPG
jgi:predicted acetyltransferase